MHNADDILSAISDLRTDIGERLAHLEERVGQSDRLVLDHEARLRETESKTNRAVGAVAVVSLVLSVVGYQLQHLLFKDAK